MHSWRRVRHPGRQVIRSERGTATLEFVGVLPLILLVSLIAVQLVVAGFTLWSASVSARAGARAAHLGFDPVAAARSALPGPMRGGTQVRRSAGVVTTRVPVLRVVPLLPPLKIEARSGLEAG